jgi:hypothetical protein
MSALALKMSCREVMNELTLRHFAASVCCFQERKRLLQRNFITMNVAGGKVKGRC